MTIIAQAEIQILPDTSAFAAALSRQLTPIVAQAGVQASAAFSRGFGGAGEQAARQVADKFTQSASGLLVPAGAKAAAAIGSGIKAQLPSAVSQAAAASQGAFQEAGRASGRTFGSGVGEGFAALAAFGIARGVERFFKGTADAAIQFQQAMAGVNRAIELSPEQFGALSTSILEMSERLPFASSAIANVAAEAGRLGVGAGDIEAFTETVLKFSRITGQGPEAVATSLARFANVTQTSLADTDQLADVILKLGTASAATEEEVLLFTRRLAPLAAESKVTNKDVLGLATALAQSGVQAEAGGTAIVQTFNKMQAAASSGGAALARFAQVTGTSSQAFADLVRNDPTQAFLDLLNAIRGAGTESQSLLASLGLGSQRVSISLRALATSGDKVTEAITNSRNATGELARQTSIFTATAAAKIETLKNTFQNTRIEIGGKLAPVLIALLEPIAHLSSTSVGLSAAFAGVAAGGFAFIRSSNILREFSGALGGTRLSMESLAAAERFAVTNGLTLRATLAGVRNQTVLYSAAATEGELATLRFAGAESTASVASVKFGTALTSARASGEGYVASVLTAARSTGALNVALKSIGVASLVFIGLDLAADAMKRFQSGLDRLAGVSAAKGVASIDSVSAALLKFTAGLGSAEEVSKAARIDILPPELFNVKAGIFTEGVSQVRTIQEQFNKLLTSIPLVGTPFKATLDIGERAKKVFSDINAGFEKLLQTSGPQVAEATFGAFRTELEKSGVRIDLFNQATVEFQTKLRGAKDETASFNIPAEVMLARLTDLKVPADEARAVVEKMGLKFKEAANSTEALGAASQATKAALAGIASAGTAFDAKLDTLVPKFGEFIVNTSKTGAAATKASKDLLQSARQVADAQRALDDARLEAAKRIKDAQLALSKAEADAIDKVIEARRRLEDERFRSTRSVRDAQEQLQDFQAALARTGGTLTPDDAIRLRELTQAVSDALQDASRTEIEGQRNVGQAISDGNDKVAESRRKLADDNDASAKRIIDAQRNLARAIEDAAKRAEKAGGAQAAAQELTVASLAESFRKNTADLNLFTDSLTSIQSKLRSTAQEIPRSISGPLSSDAARLLADRTFGPFLARLQELGPAAAGFLAKLAKESPESLSGLAGGLAKEIAAAKKAADFQFDKFPANFAEKLSLANSAVGGELDNLVALFENTPGKTADVAAEIASQMDAIGLQIDASVKLGTLALTDQQRQWLADGLAAKDAQEKFQDFKNLSESLTSPPPIVIKVDSKDATKAVDTLASSLDHIRREAKDTSLSFEGSVGSTASAPSDFQFSGGKLQVHDQLLTDQLKTIFPFVSGGNITAAQFGLTARAGQTILTGERGPELFIPNSAGAIFKATDTERILRALRSGGRGGTVQNVQINEVANDPRATARAVSFALGSEAIR